jgi:hypothetical protein
VFSLEVYIYEVVHEQKGQYVNDRHALENNEHTLISVNHCLKNNNIVIFVALNLLYIWLYVYE